MSHLKRFAHALSITFLLITCGQSISAQEEQDKKIQPAPTGLSVEVDTKEGPIGYQSVPGESFGGRYRRLASWRPGGTDAQPYTFEMIDLMEGDAVRVKVYALMDRFREQKILIGDFLLREGERAAVEGMKKYGYEPMSLSIVRVKQEPVVLPEAATRAPSVLPINVEARPTNFPSFKLTLRNLSDKNITFLEIHTFRGGMLSTSEWKRGEQNRPMIKAGGTYDVIINGGDDGWKDRDGYTPSTPQRVEIVAAGFDDKSYEGEMKSAAGFAASLRGQKIQIKRALAILEDGTRAGDQRSALENFKQQALSLGRVARPEEVEEVSAEFPGLPVNVAGPLKVLLESGMDKVRKELLKDIDDYSQARERASESRPVDVWLGDLKQKYESWLSRL